MTTWLIDTCWGNISLSCLGEEWSAIDPLIFFLFHQFSGLNHIQVLAPPPPPPSSSFHQTTETSTLTETTLKQLEVLSEMLRLMTKPNNNSERLKADIVHWTSSAVSVNLSHSELQPNQIQILRWGHNEQTHTHTHMHTDTLVHAHVHRFGSGLLCCSLSDVLWDAERQSGARAPPLLLCLRWWFPDAR